MVCIKRGEYRRRRHDARRGHAALTADEAPGCSGCLTISAGEPMPAQNSTQPVLFDQPQHLHFTQPACGCGGVGHGRTLVPRAGAEGVARWAAARARSHPHGSRPKPGFAPGTVAALALSCGTTAQCFAAECRALVDLRVARRAAKAAGRDYFEAGDGCAGRLCSADHRPPRFRRRQAAMARALLGGKRTLVAWPSQAAARVELWAEPACVTELVASAVLERQRSPLA